MKFSEAFGIKKSQAELDFVDIPLHTDIPLFIDPYALSKRRDNWSDDCHKCVVDYFQMVIETIREGNDSVALKLLSHLSEPNETRLGLSKRKPMGRGVAKKQASELFNKLKQSNAVKTGILTELEECDLYIEGIARDKISDITTNITKYYLIQYTAYQCDLLNVKTQKDVASGFFWNPQNRDWEQDFFNLPVFNGQKIILVPKAVVRYDLAYDYQNYYNNFIVNFLQAEHSADESLVRTLKSGEKRPPYKKDIKSRYPISKDFVYSFTREHPDVLEKYKKSISGVLREITNEEIADVSGEGLDSTRIIDSLISKLRAMAPGQDNASVYHDLVIGILEVIFYPVLINPRKQYPLHEGRKIIDITYDNASKKGFFVSMVDTHRLPCPRVIFECKNYSGDPANPELDQLIGRFSLNFGMVGFLVCRNIKNKKLFLKRCNDTYKDDKGCIIPLQDEDLINLLEITKRKEDSQKEDYLQTKLKEMLSI